MIKMCTPWTNALATEWNRMNALLAGNSVRRHQNPTPGSLVDQAGTEVVDVFASHWSGKILALDS
jgi:uncharacterized protein YceK